MIRAVAEPSNSDLATEINTFVTQDVATSGSASLGECDMLPYLDGSMAVDDAALAEAAEQGQTFFASTGDTGSSCAVLPTNGVPLSGPPDTEYPASSPYTTAVGGTTLLTDPNDNYTDEVAWNAGGGGISPVELYALDGQPGYHDVVLGVNGTYAATPGWDYTTGLGSWDVDVLSQELG